MNKIKRQTIAGSISRAGYCCDDAFRSYKPYMPTLDHKAALEHLAEAQRFIADAIVKILNEAIVSDGNDVKESGTE